MQRFLTEYNAHLIGYDELRHPIQVIKFPENLYPIQYNPIHGWVQFMSNSALYSHQVAGYSLAHRTAECGRILYV